MAYGFKEYEQLEKDFKTIFDANFMDYCDILLTELNRKFFIDIVKFDLLYLQYKHGSYIDDEKSFSDIVFEHYGDGGAALIDELI